MIWSLNKSYPLFLLLISTTILKLNLKAMNAVEYVLAKAFGNSMT
jgi:hypothetical protein